MKKTLLFSILILLVSSPHVLARTPWESYLALPAPEYASKVAEIEYTPGSATGGSERLIDDLRILRNQVLAGDGESFRLAYRLIENSDDGSFEELVAILSHTIRVDPEFFLAQMAKLHPQEKILEAVLMTPGTEYADRTYAQRYELYMRKLALTGVSDIKLKDIREMCLELIKIY